jgi:hypothetical protein
LRDSAQHRIIGKEELRVAGKITVMPDPFSVRDFAAHVFTSLVGLPLKDKLTLLLSGVAAIISVVTFCLTYIQRRRENRRALRRSLTDVISELNKVNVAFAKLEIENPHSADDLILNLRRQYSDQRWFFANEAEFVSEKIPKLVTDIDALMIAHAFMTVHDYGRSERFFKLAVSKARNNNTRSVSLRNLAQFYFRKGDARAGRKIFEEALQDTVRESASDLYLFWAREEKQAGCSEESERLTQLAKESASNRGTRTISPT